jgi:uncharacterized membrane protein
VKWPKRSEMILVAIVLLVSAGLIGRFVAGYAAEAGIYIEKAKVVEVDERIDYAAAIKQGSQDVTLDVLTGPLAGRTAKASNLLRGDLQLDTPLSVGDVAIVAVRRFSGELQGRVLDFDRQDTLILLVGIFAGLLLLLAGWQAIRTLTALLFTGSLIVTVLLPLVLHGVNAVAATMVVCAIAACVTLLLVAGLQSKAFVALAGALCGVFISGELGILGTQMMKLPGVTSGFEEMLYFSGHIQLQLRDMFYGAILIASLGIVIDQAVGIASVQHELIGRDPYARPKALWDTGLAVGRDVMGTMAAAVIMVFVGSSMAMMLLFVAQGAPIQRVVNYNFVASEALYALCSSIGSMSATPITAAVGALVYSGELRRLWGLARGRGSRPAVSAAASEEQPVA